MSIVKYVGVAFFLSVDRPHHNVARQGPPYPTPPSRSLAAPPSSTTYPLLSLLLVHNNRQEDNGRHCPAAPPNNNTSFYMESGSILLPRHTSCHRHHHHHRHRHRHRRSLRIIMECWASFLPTYSQNMGCADVYNNNNTFLIRGVAHQ